MSFPRPGQGYDPRWASELVRALNVQDGTLLRKGQDVDPYPGRIILRSPNGQRFVLRVTDAGDLQAVPV